MKRNLLVMTFAAGLMMAGCGQSKNAEQNADTTAANGGKVLVAYFSYSGVTAKAAATLAEVTGGTLHEIVPEQPYTEADLDWRDTASRSTLEMKDKGSRPAIANRVENMGQYETVYVGFPIWWHVAPTIINTFLEQYELSGKTVVPFFTSGGSEAGETLAYLRPSAPTANWMQPLNLNGKSKEDMARMVSGK